MQQKTPSNLQKIFRRGALKVNNKKGTGRLLMHLSEHDHKRIALLIQQWLKKDKSTTTPQR